MFKLNVVNTEIIVEQRDTLTSGSINSCKIQFTFDSNWDGLERIATFSAGDVDVSTSIDDSGICCIPWEVVAVDSQTLQVGVYGKRDNEVVLPTVWTSLGYIHRGATPSSPSSSTPMILDDIPVRGLGGKSVRVSEIETATAKEGATVIGDVRQRKFSGDSLLEGNIALGENAIAGGTLNKAIGDSSVALGRGVEAHSNNQHVRGKYNQADTNDEYAVIVGNGSDDSHRSNAHTIDWEGNGWFSGEVRKGGTSYHDADNLVSSKELSVKADKIKVIPHTSVSGYPISITDNLAGENVINYQVYGNSVQDGTPTPEIPIEIQSVGDLVTSGEYAGKYDVPVTVCGKNLLKYPYTYTTKTINGITFTDNGDGTITVNGTATADATFYLRSASDKITLSAGTYTMSGCPKGSSSTTYYIGGFSYNMFENSQTFTLSKTTHDWFYITIKSGVNADNLIFKPQIELGTSATSYEPYVGETKHIYLDEPLRKLGNYADYIDYEKQKVIRNIVKIRLTGPFEKYNDIIWQFNTGNIILQTRKELCSHFRIIYSSKEFGLNNKNATGYYVMANNMESNMGLTRTEFNTWLTENEVYYYAVLVTPTEESITIEPMPLGEGTNNITIGTTIQPSNVIFDYYQDPKEILNNKVDKEDGKVLSSNDFTDAEKIKLSKISEGAEVNVQSDWNETDTESDGYIRNKPSIYTRAESDNRYLPRSTASGTTPKTEYAIAENAKNYQVYGNSIQLRRSGKNLLPYPYTETTKTENGITFTDNGDGTIAVSGTAASSGTAAFELGRIDLASETQYVFSGVGTATNILLVVEYYKEDGTGLGSSISSSGVTSTTISSTGNPDAAYVILSLRARQGEAVSGVVKPQLEVGSTATSYEQYGVMPSPDYPSEIQSVGNLVTDETSEYYGKYDVPVTVCGKNLLKYPYKDSTKTAKGITFTDNGDGTITINGTATENVTFYMQYKTTLILPGSYTFSASADMPSDKGDIRIVVYDTEMFGKYARTKDGVQFTVSKPSEMVVNVTIKSGATMSDLLLKPQLEIGSTATEYEPYIGETKHIYLDEPLRKLGDYADYIDYEQQKVIRNIVKIRMAGPFERYNDVIWQFNTGKFILKTRKEICTHFLNSEFAPSGVGVFNKNATGYYMCINRVESIMGLTLSEFNAWLTENEVYYYTVLATPTEEPIILAPMPLKEGTNNITTDTVIQPSNVIVDYYQNPSEIITNLMNAILAQGGNV